MATGDVLAGPVVEAADLTRVYRSATGETYALRGVDLALLPGSLTVVAGPSGSGKSSLLTLLSARERPSAGELRVLGSDVAGASAALLRRLRHRRIGYVPQRASTGLFPHLTATAHVRQVASWRRDRHADVDAVLDAVGLAARGGHRPATMSGGEQQRLAVGWPWSPGRRWSSPTSPPPSSTTATPTGCSTRSPPPPTRAARWS
ncbi:ATP-binding cassette domain-containing protein [Nocardioides deserti]|uniref:ATP-binding cassette domain-containing protein n=1 Tax=Nocardioides deserti TaxID=1588644 RepID=A0ABR6U431_9ACTN|nr:ATP-binding cassette domain-containing protein [Nocardioides deserti]MBC2959164.1 ATP-binding cassette domain-containing protein [Nocardioides deserti]GGO68522.1 hypothetical protein GCM10012276_02530 [Nocardioides deserti]